MTTPPKKDNWVPWGRDPFELEALVKREGRIGTLADYIKYRGWTGECMVYKSGRNWRIVIGIGLTTYEIRGDKIS